MSELAARNYLERPVSLDVLGTTDCLSVVGQLVRFENEHRGADFFWSLEQKEAWLRSGTLFCSAIAEGDQLVALTSMFITTQRSMDEFLAGKITENQLSPWFLGDGGAEAVFYFVPISKDTTPNLLGLYDRLLVDITTYLAVKRLKVPAAYSMAFSPAAEQHLAINGFEAMAANLGGPPYLPMRIDAFSAKAAFWQRLLPPPEMCSDPAKAVESRLRASKAERYRDFYKIHVKSSP
jgi:hypothetical protein